jgi:N-methylhydantoinase B
LTPLIQHRRELRIDSGGAGKYRGGLGQSTEMRCTSGQPWEVSAMIDRIKFPGFGLLGGAPGVCGEFSVDQVPKPAKLLLSLAPSASVQLNLPGGGGYGNPLERLPELVLKDVIDGYVSIEAARDEYRVAISYSGSPDQLVRLPEHFSVDDEATQTLRAISG